jgi:hypothetical protein
MKTKKKSGLILMLALLTAISCAKKEDDDTTSVTLVDMPDFTARCKYTIPSAGYCDGTPQGSGGMNGRKGLVLFFNSDNELVTGQMGDLVCGDSGGDLGVHCSFETSPEGWINEENEAVTQIPAGTYSVSFQLDKDGNVASFDDLDNFTTGDTNCGAEITIDADTTTILDDDATLLTCLTIPAL